MKFKISLMVTIFLTSGFLDASSSASSSLPADRKFPLTQEDIDAHRERQVAVQSSMPKPKTIGTLATLHIQVNQMFVYGLVYKQIGLREFFEQYSDEIEEFKGSAQAIHEVSYDKIDMIHQELKAHKDQRIIEDYEIVGEMPSYFTVNIDRDEDEEEEIKELNALFYIAQARKYVYKAVKDYIDQNYDDVRSKCIGSGLSITTSTGVYNPGCCDVQLHKECFLQCKANHIARCVNLFCQKGKDGQCYPSNWTPGFYKDVLTKDKKVKQKDMYNAQCPVCTEPLKSEAVEAQSPRLKDYKRRKQELIG